MSRRDRHGALETGIYVFALASIFQPLETTPITVSFRYPVAAAAAAVTARPATSPPASPAEWKYRGDRRLRPQTITDDGVHIEIAWAAGAAIPAVFAVDAEGREALVNGMMREGRFVVDAIAPRLVFRLDRQVGQARRVRARKTR